MTDVTKYGAVGDGITDCSPAIAKALATEPSLYFPAGTYVLTEPLRIPSHRHLKLHRDATLFAADHCFDKAGTLAIIVNADMENGNENILLEGGKVDANNLHNGRADWIKGPNCGLTFSFKRVKGLTVRDLVSHNADSYNFHLCRVEDFTIENITFTATHLPLCQDGIHVGAFCHRGVIRNIHAAYGCTNDDLLAFSADELHDYIHNTGLEDGPISDMLIENVTAENCWSAVRILSVDSEIRNLTFRNMKVGVRMHGINMDASRHLAHPLYTDAERPHGAGNVKNIRFEDITLWRMPKLDNDELLKKHGLTIDVPGGHSSKFNIFETLGDVTVKNLRRDLSRDHTPDTAFLYLNYLHGTEVTVNGETFTMHGEERRIQGDHFDLSFHTK